MLEITLPTAADVLEGWARAKGNDNIKRGVINDNWTVEIRNGIVFLYFQRYFAVLVTAFRIHDPLPPRFAQKNPLQGKTRAWLYRKESEAAREIPPDVLLMASERYF